MRLAVHAVLLSVALMGESAAAATTADRIDAVARQTTSTFRIPGLSVAVVLGGRLVYARGFGWADLASKAPATAETVYPIGSISKQFTAAAVLKLVETGKIGLADPVRRHVPEYWPHGSSATIEHLLRHTAGVREFFSIPAAARLIDDPRGTIDDVMTIVAHEALVFPAGSRWSYSNSGYHLAARAIEKAAGKPYEGFLQSAFFDPLQLGSLHHCRQAPQPPRDASGYTLRRGRHDVARWENMNTARGDGGLCGNVVDLVRWVRLLARGDVVGPASFGAMTRPTSPTHGPNAPYGMGVGLLPLDGRDRISHTGEIGGFSAAAAYYPGDDLAVAVLSNLAGVPVEAIERAIARAVLDLQAPRFTDLPVPAELRRRLTGRWEIGIPGFVIQVVDKESRLAMRMPPPGWSGELRYQGQGRFVSAQVPDVRYVLVPDPAARDRLTIGMGDMHWDARRIVGDPDRR